MNEGISRRNFIGGAALGGAALALGALAGCAPQGDKPTGSEGAWDAEVDLLAVSYTHLDVYKRQR